LDAVAEDMNVCDEAVAIDVVKEILMSDSQKKDMRQYKRHTELVFEDASLGTIEKVTDCLVCFNKHHYHMKLN
jgi:hypothetical protein